MRTLYTILVVLVLDICGYEGQAKCIRVYTNRPIQEQFKESNTTYLLKDRVDLRGDTIVLPLNSVLKFRKKGQLVNGFIIGNSTLLKGHPSFDKVRLSGSFQNTDYYSSWCSLHTISDYVEDVMNLSESTVLIVDCDFELTDTKRNVSHLNLRGKEGNIITNSDRYYITYGGCEISDLRFKWNKGPVKVPKDNYSAVIIYHDLLQKDTTITISIRNVEADGGRYCSHFMKQYKSSIEPHLQTVNRVISSAFVNFTQGAIWTCGGTGEVVGCSFQDIGYETTSALKSVFPLRLGYSNIAGDKAKAIGYEVEDCVFSNIVASYNAVNDGRELHGLLAYGDSIHVVNNQFRNLSTSFSKCTDTGMDSEMLYIKGSYNIIDNNTFTNGTGSRSDAVVTLKTPMTDGNVIRNNHFLLSSSVGKFIYLGGRNHIIEGNEFRSSIKDTTKTVSYAIYLSHHDEDKGHERVMISDNVFSFTGTDNYMAVYANRRGDLSIQNNTFINPSKLLKCNKREGNLVVNHNTISMERVNGELSYNFIEISGDQNNNAEICHNSISLVNSTLGSIVTGTNYLFNNNCLTIQKSFMQTILRGDNTEIETCNNTVTISDDSHFIKDAFVGQLESGKVISRNNSFQGKTIKEKLK